MAAERSRTESVVEHELRIAAAPETVFEYFVDPVKMVEWMGLEATLDPRPGGVCRVSLAGGASVAGEFVEIDRPRRIVFTWGWELALFSTPPQSTVVEVSLTPDGEETVVRLSHTRLNPEAVAFHREGWRHYLARLALAASERDPGPDPWSDLERSVRDLMAAGVLPQPRP
jgi:uncharacterized protein YndB with AHSA1/START domain